MPQHAWDCNVPADHPEYFRALPEDAQQQLVSWVERHIGYDRWFLRVETDLIDAPLLRIWSIRRDQVEVLSVNEDGTIKSDVHEVLMREPIPAAAIR